MNSKKNFPEFQKVVMIGLIGLLMIEISRFSLHFMEVVKRNEFYGDYRHANPDLFPDENTQHPTRKHDDKDKTPFTMKEIRDYDRQRLQYLQNRGYNVEIIWESNWNTLC